jgi:hypothetical protein
LDDRKRVVGGTVEMKPGDLVILVPRAGYLYHFPGMRDIRDNLFLVLKMEGKSFGKEFDVTIFCPRTGERIPCFQEELEVVSESWRIGS